MKTKQILEREKSLIPIGLAAVLAGVSDTRMRYLVQQGRVRCYAWLGAKLVSWASVEAYMREQGRCCAEGLVALNPEER